VTAAAAVGRPRRAAPARACPALSAAALSRWRQQPTAFIEEVLHDPETGEPYRLLPAERRFLEHAFKTNTRGRLLYPEQLFAAPKKSGKTAFAAMHTLTTVLLFGGAYPEATILANDLDQAQARVFATIKRIIECSPLLRAEAKITTDTVSFPIIGATITAIGSDYAGAAGGNQNISCFDELWAYTSERSRRLWDEMVPPPTRKVALRLTTTYAGFEGESTLLEELRKRGHKQPLVGPDLHAGAGLLMFWSHRPIAPWQTPEWIEQMRGQLRPAAFLRMIENRFVSSESTFIDMAWWDACVDPSAHPLLADKALPVWIGVDASVKRDSTAIVACAWDRVANRVRLVWHRIFQPTHAEPLDFEATIESTINDLCGRFRVQEVRFDPYQMQPVSQRLLKRGVPMVEFPQSVPNLTDASQNLFELIKSRNLIAYSDAAIRLAVQRAVAVETPRGWKISKEKQAHKIDVVIALGMAALGAVQQGIANPHPIRISPRAMQWARFPSPGEAGAYGRILARQRFGYG
jgi:phage terminase large subunit-like protein